MPAPFDPHPQFQEYAHPEKLVSASWLSARLGTKGLRVVESDEDSLLYDIGHIPGAVRIDCGPKTLTTPPSAITSAPRISQRSWTLKASPETTP